VRPGPFALPSVVRDAGRAIAFAGGAAQGLPSTRTAFLTPLLFSAFVMPTTSGTLRRLLCKGSYFATTNNDFPFSFNVTTAGLAELSLSAGGDFVTDHTLTSDIALTQNAWNFVALGLVNASFSGINLNGRIKTATHAVTPSTSTHAYTLGNVASQFSGGVGGLPFIGQMLEPRLYLWDGQNFGGLSELLRRGVDWRPGLIYEWQPKVTGLRLLRA
jgi:hypothetical protein